LPSNQTIDNHYLEGILQQLTQRSFEAHESRVTKATKALLATADHDILAKEYAGKRYFYYKKPVSVHTLSQRNQGLIAALVVACLAR